MKNTKNTFRIFTAIAVLGFLISGMFGCRKQRSEPVQKKELTRTVIDHNGKEIELPAKIERVVISSLWPLPSIYCLFRGSIKNLVGMHPGSMSAAKNSYLANVFPDVVNIDTSFIENGALNIEQLMALKPDIVFYSATNEQERTMLENAGIKAVGFSTSIAQFNCIETYAKWIELLGQVFGEEKRSAEIAAYGRKTAEFVQEKIAPLGEKDKPSVLILFNYDTSGIKTSGTNFFGDYWINAAGGKNVAKDSKGIIPINMEQIYEWNPDIIFITNFSPYLPEDLYTNSIEGYDWSSIKAVQKNKVYKFPLGMYRWFPPSSDSPLSLKWLAKKIQPDLFLSIDMDTEIKNYFERFYNVKLLDSDIHAIYNPVREASGK